MAILMQRLPRTGCAWSGALWAARLPGRLPSGCSCSASSSAGTCSPWSLPSAWKPWALSGNPRYSLSKGLPSWVLGITNISNEPKQVLSHGVQGVSMTGIRLPYEFGRLHMCSFRSSLLT